MLGTVEAAPADEIEGPGAPAPEADGGSGRGRRLTVDHVLALLVAVIGLRAGIGPLHDNSFFTHLATGRIILDTHSIPRTDPYSFTAHGHAWTVQSWGASVIFAGIDRAVGLVGIRLLVAACCVALAVLSWRLTAPARSLVGRLAIAVPLLTIGLSYWVERPLIFSLLFLLAVLFAVEGRLDPRWLLPVMFAWVNIHGSFPIGLAAIVAFGLGRLLDRERPTVELRALAWAMGGTVAGVLNPLGLRLLVFPVQLLQRREAFAGIVEWQAPKWVDWGERAFAFELVLAIVLVLWRARRWRNVVPLVLFGAVSLQSTRNIVHASLVLLPVLTDAVRDLGTLDADASSPRLKPVAAVLAALFVVVGVAGVREGDLDLRDYPVRSVVWMHDHDLLSTRTRVVTRDFVGNYLEANDGPAKVRVYIDDRVDMYPIHVIDDYQELIAPDGHYAAVLRRARATAVLWDTDSDLGDWLEDPAHGWRIVHREKGWMVAVPARSAR
jgi:hypothetical protein